MTATLRWEGTLTASSSIAHGGETRGTISMLRREPIVQPDGTVLEIPIISGNAVRGRLRRTAELLLRDTLGYEGLLSPVAAHTLTGGGSLTKTGKTPLSGRRLHELRTLNPLIGVFGCAGAGRIIDGTLQVGKLVPRFAETSHLLPVGAVATPMSAFGATQLESYTRVDDGRTHDFTAASSETTPAGDEETSQMQYRIETLPAGTQFAFWLQLSRSTDLEVAFFTDVLDTFLATGRIGGRVGRGHGMFTHNLEVTTVNGAFDPMDWRTHLTGNRDAALAALEQLS